MKALILMLVLSLGSVRANESIVICKKVGRYWRPSNDRAIQIAAMLKVKTCTGTRFKAVLKKLHLKSNVPDYVTKNMTVDDVVQALK